MLNEEPCDFQHFLDNILPEHEHPFLMLPLQCIGGLCPQQWPPSHLLPLPLLFIHINTHHTEIWLYNSDTNGMTIMTGRDTMESIIRIVVPCWLCYNNNKKTTVLKTTKIIEKQITNASFKTFRSQLLTGLIWGTWSWVRSRWRLMRLVSITPWYPEELPPHTLQSLKWGLSVTGFPRASCPYLLQEIW